MTRKRTNGRGTKILNHKIRNMRSRIRNTIKNTLRTIIPGV